MWCFVTHSSSLTWVKIPFCGPVERNQLSYVFLFLFKQSCSHWDHFSLILYCCGTVLFTHLIYRIYKLLCGCEIEEWFGEDFIGYCKKFKRTDNRTKPTLCMLKMVMNDWTRQMGGWDKRAKKAWKISHLHSNEKNVNIIINLVREVRKALRILLSLKNVNPISEGSKRK